MISLGYPPLNNQTAPDDYDAAAQIISPGATRLNLIVSNQAIYYQLGDTPPNGTIPTWRSEIYCPPSYQSLDQNFDAIRVRAAIPAAQLAPGALQAQVTAICYPPDAIN